MTLIVEPFSSMTQLAPVLHDIRFLDMEEWSAGSGLLFGLAVAASLEQPVDGQVSYMVSDKEGPLCFWGGSNGQVWLFATNRATKKALYLHSILRRELKVLFDRWPILTATAYWKNKDHHKWLRWLGFEELAEVPEGPFGVPFKVFVKERD